MGSHEEVRVKVQTWVKGISVLALAAGIACSGGQPATPPAGQATSAAQPGAAASGAPGAPAAAPASAATTPAAGGSLPAVPEIPQPTSHEVMVPAGTSIAVALETPVASDTSKVEDRIRAKVTKAVVIDGATVIPEGTEVVGTVVDAMPSGRVKGRASVALRFLEIHAGDTVIPISTPRIERQAQATTKEDAKKVGIGAGAGAIIGAIAGGGKGAAVGTAIGAGAGAGTVLATKGDEVSLPSGTAFSLKLDDAIRVEVAN
jgi:hypothetical protein